MEILCLEINSKAVGIGLITNWIRLVWRDTSWLPLASSEGRAGAVPAIVWHPAAGEKQAWLLVRGSTVGMSQKSSSLRGHFQSAYRGMISNKKTQLKFHHSFATLGCCSPFSFEPFDYFLSRDNGNSCGLISGFKMWQTKLLLDKRWKASAYSILIQRYIRTQVLKVVRARSLFPRWKWGCSTSVCNVWDGEYFFSALISFF